MNYLSASETARLWGVSPRTVQRCCAAGKIAGAFQENGIWRIPETAAPYESKTRISPLLHRLQLEKKQRRSGGIYHKIQIDLTYNSNHMEGSRLTHEETRYIYETHTLAPGSGTINVDDIIETANHFRCIDEVIGAAAQPLSEAFIKKLHRTLKTGTSDSRLDWFSVGAYKQLPNEVGGQETTPPEQVPRAIRKLLQEYHAHSRKTLQDLLRFHVQLETIHPFQDGNGRVGRLILFKECLHYGIVPFIITDDLKLFYYRGLHEWKNEPGYLTDTCLLAQDRFKEVLKYFRIPYTEENK